MTGLAGLAIPSFGLIPILIGGAALLAVGGASGAYVTHKLDAGPLAQSQAQTAQAKADLSAYGARVAADAAKANALALQQSDALQTRLNALQAQLAQSQEVERAKSAKLSQLLAAATPGQTRDLGPAVLEYLARLRSANASTGAAPASH